MNLEKIASGFVTFMTWLTGVVGVVVFVCFNIIAVKYFFWLSPGLGWTYTVFLLALTVWFSANLYLYKRSQLPVLPPVPTTPEEDKARAIKKAKVETFNNSLKIFSALYKRHKRLGNKTEVEFYANKIKKLMKDYK